MGLTGNIRARACAAAAALSIGLVAVFAAHPSHAQPSAGQLRAGVHQQRSRERGLAASVGSLSALIATLERQVALVQQREDAVRAQLGADRSALAGVQLSLGDERRLSLLYTRRLARARLVLAHQLIGSYETDAPDLLTVVLAAHGFSDLLERLDFLRQARRAQQGLLVATRTDKHGADNAARRLAALAIRDQRITAGVAAQASALAGMDQLLQSRRDALARARQAQIAALHQAHNRARALQGALTALLRQQQRADARSGFGGAALNGQWAIPAAIVMCESGGQNLPPNGAGASGYYQIIPATWKGMGGSGPAAYLAGKAEQDRVAAALWNGGAGASNWVCAGLVQGG